MRILSLFDGMSCGQIALRELGAEIEAYYASEIDKFAIAQTQLNFPETIQLGDIRTIDGTKLGKIDLLIGGSPCTNLSFAGKRAGLSTVDKVEITTLDQYQDLQLLGFQFDGQSYLFWEYMRILNELRSVNPDVRFMLENVEMGKKWEKVFNDAIGVSGLHINSALVSAQNRRRIYWTNISDSISQPEDRGVLLRDILESDVDEKYYLSSKALEYLERAKNERFENVNYNNGNTKTSCLTANYRKGVHNGGETYVKLDRKGNLKTNQDKASCFTAGAHLGGNHSDMDLICVAMRGRNPENPSDRTTGAPTVQRLEPKFDGKTNCLTSVQKDNLIMQLNQSKESGGRQPYQQNRVYDENGIMPALSAELGGRNNCLTENRIRRLTPTECARLQTIPDWYRWNCSDSQQYKMLGNGWTVEVIKHIFQWLEH